VTRDVVEAFVNRFATVGFRVSAMLPAYGLAENTLTACSRLPGEGARFEEVARETLERDGVARIAQEGEESQTMVSVGRPLDEQQIAIAGDDGTPLPPRRIGEVMLRGPSVMHSYLPGTEGEASLRPDGWLATGDLGYLADGELFLTGRKKDLIIRGGRNYYPEDLETAAGRVPGIRPGRIAAFSVSGPEQERVVLAAETRPDWDRDAAALRDEVGRAVYATVRFRPDEIVLLAPSALPLTSSGKIMRPEARRLYQAGAWRTAGHSEPR
jgi:acyl-CoA synthetase (AMP-forming)/AMP-acid ligase II